MKKFLFGLSCISIWNLNAIEYEPQLDNEQVNVAKIKILPYEGIGRHRDETAHVVIALQGGTITRIESDGQENEIDFPTGVAVFREADGEGDLHSLINKTSDTIELMIIQLKIAPPHVETLDEKLEELDSWQ